MLWVAESVNCIDFSEVHAKPPIQTDNILSINLCVLPSLPTQIFRNRRFIVVEVLLSWRARIPYTLLL